MSRMTPVSSDVERKRVMMMKPDDIIARITADFTGVVPKVSWGETAFFYNPGCRLPNGVYFCSIKKKDRASDLNRGEFAGW